MATRTKQSRAAAAVPAPRFPLWGYLLTCAALLYILFEVYGPALHGPFLFDDLFLPYAKFQASHIPFRTWLGVRPILGLTFWTDFHLWGQNTFPYHAVNLLLHFTCGILLFFVFRKLLALSATAEPNRTILSVFGSVLFLFHPVQTEVAAYIASRSETLSLLFFAAAFCAFLYRRTAAINWRDVGVVLFLFLLALGSKEPAVTLPAILLLTDYFWNPGFTFAGIRANARLYVPLATVGIIGAILVLRYVASDPMIGFHIAGLGPGTYMLTESRVIFAYLSLFLFPHSQNVDYDVPLSHSLTEHGALFALAALLLLVIAAFLFRKVFPFAAYGFLAFLILLSPTSSFIPINDVMVERRLYLPFFALVLMLFEPLRRVRIRPLYFSAALGVVCCLAAYATWDRTHVWSSTLSLFEDAAQKSPGKVRVHVGYANALYHQGKCLQAIGEYNTANNLKSPDYILDYNMAAAYDCANMPQDALKVVNQSIALAPKANAYTLLAKILSEQGRLEEGLAASDTALTIEPNYIPALVIQGAIYASKGQVSQAYDDSKKHSGVTPRTKWRNAGWPRSRNGDRPVLIEYTSAVF